MKKKNIAQAVTEFSNENEFITYDEFMSIAFDFGESLEHINMSETLNSINASDLKMSDDDRDSIDVVINRNYEEYLYRLENDLNIF